MTQNKTTLLPCPMCGCELVRSEFRSTRTVERRTHPGESECILAAIIISMEDRTDDAERRAAWNTRPAAGDKETMRAALQRQVDNVEHWLATGEAASPEESRSIYEQMKAALEAGQ